MGARKLAQSKKVDAVICLGILLRGETSNYEQISQEVARGIGQAAQDTGVPCTYGVLTCDTLEQAIDRAGLKMGNKGCAAVAEMKGFPKTPRPVIINESLEIARKFSSPESVNFINGVLDSIAKEIA